MTRGEALADATTRLAAVSTTPRLDAELLMGHAGGMTREALLMAPMHHPAPAGFAALLNRRLRHEPVAYIVGHRGFWSIDLRVGYGVLIPRPDSETLIEAAVGHFRGREGPDSVLDLGTGSGALLLAALAEWRGARGIGIDASSDALRWARHNADALGLAGRARLVEGGWDAADGAYDLILCNPPYVVAGTLLPREVAAWEPAEALFAGADGLDEYRRIAPLVAPRIAPGGVACIEIGCDQAAQAGALFRAEGLDVAVRRDLGGRDRCLVVTHASQSGATPA